MYKYVILSSVMLSFKVRNISNTLAHCLPACLRITVNCYDILRFTCEKCNVCISFGTWHTARLVATEV